MNSLAMDSKWVIYGTMGGDLIDQLSLRGLMRKRANIHFTTLRNRDN